MDSTRRRRFSSPLYGSDFSIGRKTNIFLALRQNAGRLLQCYAYFGVDSEINNDTIDEVKEIHYDTRSFIVGSDTSEKVWTLWRGSGNPQCPNDIKALGKKPWPPKEIPRRRCAPAKAISQNLIPSIHVSESSRNERTQTPGCSEQKLHLDLGRKTGGIIFQHDYSI